MKLALFVFAALSLAAGCSATPFQDHGDDTHTHKHISRRSAKDAGAPAIEPQELLSETWVSRAKLRIQEHMRVERGGRAKNVIMFLGDGMSIPTIAAARAYVGQQQGKPGEETRLSFETFPATGLSKTYCVDVQVADSACSATAYLCGVKGNDATIGVNAQVTHNNCTQMQRTEHHVDSIAMKFIQDGRSAGLVTTTRVTHASPAGVYAHTANRDWENDVEIKNDGADPTECRDIAHQLVHGEVGSRLKVILGGGRREFLNSTVVDEEGDRGRRSDGRNLIDEWKTSKANVTHAYVWNKAQLMAVKDEEYLLGLFESSHCQYNLRSNKTTEPTLTEMLEVAINKLSKNEKGYFLFVEGGRIDHAHHDNLANLALEETAEFSRAIAKARAMTDDADTLIVVTSDHAHAMTFNGYPRRGNDVLGHTGEPAADGKPYATLSYANGPSYKEEIPGVGRPDPTDDPNFGKDGYKWPAMVNLSSETHGGDDVGVFALGPWQHLFVGVYEQSTIRHVMEYASCVNPEWGACAGASAPGATSLAAAVVALLVVALRTCQS